MPVLCAVAGALSAIYAKTISSLCVLSVQQTTACSNKDRYKVNPEDRKRFWNIQETYDYMLAFGQLL